MSTSPVKKQEPDSWLLRLFESEFFDSRLALSYLFRYPQNVGIHHYICKELYKFPESEIQFLLPQICHIIISRPNESVALQDFIMTICQTSNHMAILTLWYLEAYLHDLENIFNIQSHSFQLCSRLYRKCQNIIFSDTEVDIGMNRFVLLQENKTTLSKTAHIPPTLVGIGLILGSVGAPIANTPTKNLVISQSRKYRFTDIANDTDSDDDNTSSSCSSEDTNGVGMRRTRSILSHIIARIPTSSPSLEELSKGSAFSFKNFVKKTTSFHLRKQSSSSSIMSETKPAKLEKIISHSKSLDIHTDDLKLVNSHYFHAQMQFIMTLVDISERLVSFPKSARQASLIAELTLLNHNLPATVCIPFWCSADSTNPNHHQIVRISLSDCVVLNSADRVPYMILVEVIENKPHIITKRQSITSVSPLFPRSSLSTGSHKDLRVSVESHRSSTNRDSADYYLSVISRRNSATGLQSPPMTRLSPKVSPLVDQTTALINYVEPNSSTLTGRMINQDEFADKMRTAAVMLAQLYQEQQKDAKLAQKELKHTLRKAPGTRSTTPINASTIQMSDVKFQSAPSSPVVSDRNSIRMKTDFEEIRGRVIKEMTTLEAERLEIMASEYGLDTSAADELIPERQEHELQDASQRDEEDPSASVFREPWEAKKKRIQASSAYGTDPNWNLYSVIVKSGNDLRQEQLALQLISEMQTIWDFFQVPLWVYPFKMLITSEQSGLIEVIPDSISIHSLKKDGYAKKLNQPGIAFTLYDHFIKEFGQPGCDGFQTAQHNFVKSLAAYSIVSYLLQLKDRHNGNILLDLKGHITHIDFGFMLMNSPGSVGFEMAPFKLPQEYIDVMGGIFSEKFQEFRTLVRQGFLALRKKSESIITLVEIMEKDSQLPCFTGVTNKASTVTVGAPSTTPLIFPVTQALRDRFHLTMTEDVFCEHLDYLIDSSCNNMFTKLYDSFQYYANGIL